MSDLRAVNAHLRRVVVDKDELIAAQEALLSAQREQLANQAALIEGQAAQLSNQDLMQRSQAEQIGTQGEMLAAQAELIKRLQDEMAELKRQLGTHSGNSSTPPSKDLIAAKAKRRADRSSRVRSKDRKAGRPTGTQGFGADTVAGSGPHAAGRPAGRVPGMPGRPGRRHRAR